MILLRLHKLRAFHLSSWRRSTPYLEYYANYLRVTKRKTLSSAVGMSDCHEKFKSVKKKLQRMRDTASRRKSSTRKHHRIAYFSFHEIINDSQTLAPSAWSERHRLRLRLPGRQRLEYHATLIWQFAIQRVLKPMLGVPGNSCSAFLEDKCSKVIYSASRSLPVSSFIPVPSVVISVTASNQLNSLYNCSLICFLINVKISFVRNVY